MKPDDTPETANSDRGIRFDRHELAGSLGDLGTFLPIAVGLIMINGVDATAVLITAGLFYLASGAYFRTTVPVQPMKVIGAYAIAKGLSPAEISASGLWMGAFMLLLGATGAITWIGRVVPRPTIRGVQLATGILLFLQGIRFMLGETSLQEAQGSAEPRLSVTAVGPVPIGVILGIAAVMAILLLLENRWAPAAIVVIAGGAVAGLALGAHHGLSAIEIGLHSPTILPYGWPDESTLIVGLTVLALPQVPMTVGNAVLAQADLVREYFGEGVAKRSRARALSLSMGLANVLTFFVGGMPLCHGAGGLAAHYRFGARTWGSNLMIGLLLVAIGVAVGDQATTLLSMLPFAVLGALLVFAGAQLALMILDIDNRRDLFVALAILGIAMATNLAIGFLVGFILAYAFKYTRLRI